MAESFQHPATEILQSSTLLQRLERNRIEPRGVVDIGRFNSQLASVPWWMIQRSTLLDQLQRRYSSQDPLSADGTDLVLSAPSQPVPREQTLITPTTVTTVAPLSLASTPQGDAPSAIAKPIAATGTSESSPSGKFRVSRQAIPLPNVEAIASSHTPMLKEIASTSQPSPPPEQSLILPKRATQSAAQISTSHAANPSFSAKPGTTAPTAIPSQNSERAPSQSLIFPKYISQDASGAVNSSTSPAERQREPAKENSAPQDEANAGATATHNQPPVTQEIAQTLNQSPQSGQELILPKRINDQADLPSTSHSAKSSFSPQPRTEAISDPKAAVKSGVGQPSQNSQRAPSQSLIFPKYISQDASGAVNSSTSPAERQREPAKENSAPQDEANAGATATHNQPPVTQEIAQTLNQSPQSGQELILPKRINHQADQPSTSHSAKSSFSPQPGTEAISDPKAAVKSDVGQPSQNSQRAPSPSLIFPKYISQDTSGAVNSSTSPAERQREPAKENSAQHSDANTANAATQNQPPVAQEIAQTLNQSQQPEQLLILPKLMSQEAAQPSPSNAGNSGFSSKSMSGAETILGSALSRQSDSNSATWEAGHGNLNSAGVAMQNAAPSSAIAKEISVTANLLGQQNMVWRKSASTAENGFSRVASRNGQTGMSLASSSAGVQGQIARQMSTTSSLYAAEIENAMSASPDSPAVPTTKHLGEVNVAQIAEQVSRILHHQLTIERERRGMNLWY